MIVKFKEPVSARFVYINQETNKVHLMLRVIGGQEIGTDNTCRATDSLREFFEGYKDDVTGIVSLKAIDELKRYQEALVFDMSLLADNDPLRIAKDERYMQIEAYIGAITVVRGRRGLSEFLKATQNNLLQKKSNLYSMQLRPRVQDSYSTVFNPVFTVNRKNLRRGEPSSELYNAIHTQIGRIIINQRSPKQRLIDTVTAKLPINPTFTQIQQMLEQQGLELFNFPINVTQKLNQDPSKERIPVTKRYIDAVILGEMDVDESIGEYVGEDEDVGVKNGITTKEYVDALLNAYALDLWEMIPVSPFYSIPSIEPIDQTKQIEDLSIMIQFFLANLNIYCKIKNISDQNFGAVLDESRELSDQLVGTILTALEHGHNVENAICTFCNEHGQIKLSRSLNPDDIAVVSEQFARRFRVIQRSPHMDDFVVLDLESNQRTDKFVTHQGSICINFAELITPEMFNYDYFSIVLADFEGHPTTIPHQNEFIRGEVDLDIETLADRLSSAELENFSLDIQEACRIIKLGIKELVNHVAKGEQAKAERLLNRSPENIEKLLTMPFIFTDYSGRTFHCTAYEYAYWAKDTHMCRMLENHMNDATKADMLARIQAIEGGEFTYQQNGEVHHGAHFDLTELRTALQVYIDGYYEWLRAGNHEAINEAWMRVGQAQRNLPAHIMSEYCRSDKSFSVDELTFNEQMLPRILTANFLNENGMHSSSSSSSSSFSSAPDNILYPCFPLNAPNAGLGFDFAITGGASLGGATVRTQGYQEEVSPGTSLVDIARKDLVAILSLDDARTLDLDISKKYLNNQLCPGIEQFINHVAKGEQAEAEILLTNDLENTQALLKTAYIFTDHSGRTFHCTAYEYAYWAKDAHMCRMLESYMDDATKAEMLARVQAIEGGEFTYRQKGNVHHSAHFDFTELTRALQAYVDGYKDWLEIGNQAAIDAAWMTVGKAQRNLPAHALSEYCRPDKSFSVDELVFNEQVLPRILTANGLNRERIHACFPLNAPNAGLGFDFAIARGSSPSGATACTKGYQVEVSPDQSLVDTAREDLAAILSLDEVRTADLEMSRKYLNNELVFILSIGIERFVNYVAKGEQANAAVLLNETPENTQTLLKTPFVFTDYSGRTFNCTAYEYAYWAKDRHMCRMLESYMDDATKVDILARVKAIEGGKFIYRHKGEKHHDAHFDFTELKTALKNYIDGYDNWVLADNKAAIDAAWMAVGKAQRNLPAHVIAEYCRPDRTFAVGEFAFSEPTLSRTLTAKSSPDVSLYAFFSPVIHSCFPLSSPNSGLGFDFAITRGSLRGGATALSEGHQREGSLGLPLINMAKQDLVAISFLDEARTLELDISQKYLNYELEFLDAIGIERLLNHVAKGEQAEAKRVLTQEPHITQTLLTTPFIFTDYSGRTFNCTAYEYAYWAKDGPMCSMLGTFMNKYTKAKMLDRIEAMENGEFTYRQKDKIYHNAHFDFTELNTALQTYIDGYKGWLAAGNRPAIERAWMDVGKAQRNLPAHVMSVYCKPEVDELNRNEPLPRQYLSARDFNVSDNAIFALHNKLSCFPLTDDSGLGFDFAITRGDSLSGATARTESIDGRISFAPVIPWVETAAHDLAAMYRLDQTRTNEIAIMREWLNAQVRPSNGMSM